MTLPWFAGEGTFRLSTAGVSSVVFLVFGLDRVGEDRAVGLARAAAFDTGVAAGGEGAGDLVEGEEVATAAPLGGAGHDHPDAVGEGQGAAVHRGDRGLELLAASRGLLAVVVPAAAIAAAPALASLVVILVVVVLRGAVVLAAPAAPALVRRGGEGAGGDRRGLRIVERGLGRALARRAGGGGQGEGQEGGEREGLKLHSDHG